MCDLSKCLVSRCSWTGERMKEPSREKFLCSEERKMKMTVMLMVLGCMNLAGRCGVVLGREKTDLSQALHTSPDLPSSTQVGFWDCPQAFAMPY